MRVDYRVECTALASLGCHVLVRNSLGLWFYDVDCNRSIFCFLMEHISSTIISFLLNPQNTSVNQSHFFLRFLLFALQIFKLLFLCSILFFFLLLELFPCCLIQDLFSFWNFRWKRILTIMDCYQTICDMLTGKSSGEFHKKTCRLDTLYRFGIKLLNKTK